jgi:hypothetical protein
MMTLGRSNKGGKGGFKGRKGDSSNADEMRGNKMGGDRGGSKPFNKKGNASLIKERERELTKALGRVN